MIPQVMTFQEIWDSPGLVVGRASILLGNGFSMAFDKEIFSYQSLLETADSSAMPSEARQLFEEFDTKDFERVMSSLRIAAQVVRVYDPITGLPALMEEQREELKNALVRAITSGHPLSAKSVRQDQYEACRTFLSRFDRIFTLNYDLLLYWTINQRNLSPSLDHLQDGFYEVATPDDSVLKWSGDNQDIHFLHGGLHLFESETNPDHVYKLTYSMNPVPLSQQIKSQLDEGRFPLVVTEGEHMSKLRKIRSSEFLRQSYEELQHWDGRTYGTMFILGHSLDDTDEHILRAIRNNRHYKRIFVGTFGDINNDRGSRFVRRALEALEMSQGEANRVGFFDAKRHPFGVDDKASVGRPWRDNLG